MRTSNTTHKSQPWKAHDLLADFRIEDVWRLPISLEEKQEIKEVQAAFVESIGQIGKTGMAGQLFKLRAWLGKVFHWEDEPPSREQAKPGLVKKRYAKLVKTDPDTLPKGGFDSFDLVYCLADESLLEIENKTVQAAVHFGKVRTNEHSYDAEMAIYVKPNGLFGQCYMLAIAPFRHYIVYPALLKALGRQWKNSMDS